MKSSLSLQWEFLYWRNSSFILNQLPDYLVNIVLADGLPMQEASASAGIMVRVLSKILRSIPYINGLHKTAVTPVH